MPGDVVKRMVVKLLALVVGSFVFAFALVPIYEVFCEVTGLGGRTGDQVSYQVIAATADTSRSISVRFVTTVAEGIGWDFQPPNPAVVQVYPGELRRVSFSLSNSDSRAIVAQAVPSLVPGQMARYLQKVECFCFEQQRLAAGAQVAMPLVFQVDRDLPPDVDSLTLNYTIYDVTNRFRGGLAQAN